MKWFRGCTTAEEVKARYHELLMKHHPDNGGDVATCQEINAEFTEAFNRLKSFHKTASGERYQKDTDETAEQFKEVLEKIIHLSGVKIEIIGSWIWVTGNTIPYKDYMKQNGFKWAPKHVAWTWHTGEYKKRTSRTKDMDGIRAMWGSQEVNTEEAEKIQN